MCMSDVIDRVDMRLGEIGKTWADLGRSVGASDQRLYNWRNRGIPKTAMLGVARFLGWTVDNLLTGEGSPLINKTQRAGDGSTASDTPEQAIAALLAVATPQGTKELVRLAELAQHGQLEDTDLKMLKLICERYKDR